MERICGPRLSRKRRSTSRVALRKKKLRRVCVKNQRSREGLGCYHGESYHGDASVAPPTDVGAVVRKKGKRRRGREREREKMKKSRNEPLSGEELETDETGMETLSGMEAWQEMGVPLPIIKALKDLGFTSPTAIQQQAIPVAMDTPNDIIGAAETGSGKTLAFSIPILNHIIANDPRATPKSKRSDVMITSSENRGRKDSMPEAEIVDLNLVLHSEEEDEEEGEEEGEEDGEEEEGEEDGEEEEGEEESKDDRFETESGRSLEADDEGASTKKRGLVSCLDDIPEEKFMKMISDSGSPEPTRFRSHDGSHDLGGDVTAESHDGSRDLGMLALILTPTRELALQIRCHIRDAAEYTGIEVCVLVGGMADAKQERMLSRHPPIVVATPGRLWKMMSEGHPYLTSLGSVRYLVLDEADRMIEFGHYHELSRILERLNRVTRGAEFGGVANVRQTFVFSATLSLPRRSSEKRVKVRQKKNLSGQESIDNLISQVGLREDAIVVDVARATGTTETLSEMKIMCSSEEKLVYLYQFLLLYPGRTLIFTNSISTLKRLCSLLELLRLKPHPLHARMQQRQRLKNFDRFSTSSEGLLLASDVAARGLDFPNVHHVIHYDAPLNSELYVHRSGRTARAKREGLSLLLIGPEDMTSYKNICKSLKREGLPSFPMDTSYMRDIRQRVGVARKLETALHRRKKIKRETDWIQSTARALELELDQDWYGMKTDSTGTQESDREQVLKAELKRLLDVPVMPRSVSMMYPTHDSNHKLLKKLAGVAGHERSRQIITTDTNDALKVAKKATSHTTRT